jgi:hypothetical protein
VDTERDATFLPGTLVENKAFTPGYPLGLKDLRRDSIIILPFLKLGILTSIQLPKISMNAPF